MKKALVVLTTLLLLSGVLFASGEQETSAVDMPREVTIWEGLWANAAVSVTNLAETPLYMEAMKRTGINVTWIHPPQGQDSENFNLMIASNDLPDMIYYNWNSYPGGPEKAISDGVIVKANDIVAKYSPNLTALYAKHPDWFKAAKTDNGTLTGWNFIRGHQDLEVFFGPQMRKDWLDELGLEVPVTLDDWDDVLSAVKASGKADSPLTFTNLTSGRGMNASSAFIQAFGTTWDFHQDDNGKVTFGPYEAEFKDFLVFFKDWYDRGLVDPEFISNERKTFDAKVVNGDAFAWVSYTGSGIGAYLDAHRGDGTSYDLIAAPYPVLNKGDVPFFGQKDSTVKPEAMAMTTQAVNVPVAAEWADYPYGAEGHILFNFGIAGENFDWVKDYPGFAGIEFPKYNDLMNNNPDGKTLSQMGGLYTRSFYSGPIVQDERYIYQYAWRPAQREAIVVWGVTEASKHMLAQNITATPDESEDLAAIMSEVNTYRDEMAIKFITGQENLSNFAAYQAQLKKMGIERAIEIKQAGLDRYNAR